jgi:hypothetical protein
MTNPSADVERLMADLTHPLKDGVQRLREAIRAADDGIAEHVKWKAPSYTYAGVDRVTFNLRRADQVQLVFHRGAKVNDAPFAFDDPSGLMAWPAPDRAIVTFGSLPDIDANLDTVQELVGRWVHA